MPFNIGPGELILILIIALVVLGPGKLPDVASSLGKSVREFRKAATDVTEAGKLDAGSSASTTSPVTPAATAPVDAPPPVAPPPPPPVAEAAADDEAAPTSGAASTPARDPNLP